MSHSTHFRSFRHFGGVTAASAKIVATVSAERNPTVCAVQSSWFLEELPGNQCNNWYWLGEAGQFEPQYKSKASMLKAAVKRIRDYSTRTTIHCG